MFVNSAVILYNFTQSFFYGAADIKKANGFSFKLFLHLKADFSTDHALAVGNLLDLYHITCIIIAPAAITAAGVVLTDRRYI